jgi:hypothetical protein
MRVLELCANSSGPRIKDALSYVKYKNQRYKESGINDITVLNFSLNKGGYEENVIKVISKLKY